MKTLNHIKLDLSFTNNKKYDSFMTFLIELIREIILGGVETVVAFTSWDWIGANPWAEVTRVTLDNCCSRRSDTWI